MGQLFRRLERIGLISVFQGGRTARPGGGSRQLSDCLFLLGSMAIMLLLVSCSEAPLENQSRYVTTIHPFKEILGMVVGENEKVHKLLASAASPHTHELVPSDIKVIKGASALFYGAPNLDSWALNVEYPKQIILLNMLPDTFLLYLQTTHNKNEPDTVGIDPHFWNDPLAVKALLPVLADTLCRIDTSGCDVYRRNMAASVLALEDLYRRVAEKMAPLAGRAVILSHPFFQYFLNRFGIKLVDIIETIPGKEPTARDIQAMIQHAKTEKVSALFTLPQLSERPAEIIAEATGIKIYELDPLGGIPGRQTYEELMMYNVNILIEALQ